MEVAVAPCARKYDDAKSHEVESLLSRCGIRGVVNVVILPDDPGRGKALGGVALDGVVLEDRIRQ
jgi:hypothetical protein